MTNKIEFNESEIRPRDLIKGQQDAINADVEFLQSRVSEFVKVNCPACDKVDFTKKYYKNGFHIVECNNCKTLYTNPRPTEDILDTFYASSVNYAYWNKYIFPASEEIRKEKIFKRRVNEVLRICDKYNVNTNSLLEVGAGFGTFCEVLKSFDVFEEVVAIEPTPGLAETCRKKGITTLEKPVSEVFKENNRTYNVVVNFEVIEHLFSPKEFISHCFGLLEVGGLFIVTCPNGQGFDIITLKETSNTIDHEHLNYFNPNSLELLLTKYGFEILESSTPGVLDADIVRNAVIDKKIDINDQPFLNDVLINRWDEVGANFQSFLIENGFSSNMWIVARKKM